MNLKVFKLGRLWLHYHAKGCQCERVAEREERILLLSRLVTVLAKQVVRTEEQW